MLCILPCRDCNTIVATLNAHRCSQKQLQHLRYLTLTEIIVKLLQIFPTDINGFHSKTEARSQLLGQIYFLIAHKYLLSCHLCYSKCGHSAYTRHWVINLIYFFCTKALCQIFGFDLFGGRGGFCFKGLSRSVLGAPGRGSRRAEPIFIIWSRELHVDREVRHCLLGHQQKT